MKPTLSVCCYVKAWKENWSWYVINILKLDYLLYIERKVLFISFYIVNFTYINILPFSSRRNKRPYSVSSIASVMDQLQARSTTDDFGTNSINSEVSG